MTPFLLLPTTLLIVSRTQVQTREGDIKVTAAADLTLKSDLIPVSNDRWQ